MDVLNIEEQKDGSAIVTLNMTEEENNILIEYAVINILREQIKRMKNENKRVCFDCGEEINGCILKEFPDTEICSDCLNDG